MSAKVHVHLHVADLAKSRAFYEKFFGVAPVKVKPGYLKFLPPLGPVNLALSEGRPGTRPQASVDHLGIQVETPAAVRTELARVKAVGLPVREEMGVDCCHANQDKFWVEDPDGVEWEVYHLNYDLDEEPRPATAGLSMTKASGCCGSSDPGPGPTVAQADDLKTRVQERYGRAAVHAATGASACCGPSTATPAANPVTSDLYRLDETADLPAEALRASLGCGNPVALADLRPGEAVLDLGSGGGLDVLLSARRVGPTGKAYGLDMTDEMLALSRQNQAKAGVRNAEFLKGEIEAIPLPDASVDVIVSNCVINLSADKRRVLAEAFRVLRPGGRLAISDIVVAGAVPEPIRSSVEAWIGCVAGALEETEYKRLLAEVGFEAIDLEPTRIYRAADARAFLESCGEPARAGGDLEGLLPEVDGKYRSAFIRGRKPRGAPVARPALERARREDLPAVLGLLEASRLPLEGVAEHLDDFLVARADGALIGCVGMERYGENALLRSLAVAPSRRGAGLGRSLTERLIEDACRRGVKRLFLLTETAADFFARAGFERIAREEADPAVRQSVEFREACCVSAACMRRDL